MDKSLFTQLRKKMTMSSHTQTNYFPKYIPNMKQMGKRSPIMGKTFLRFIRMEVQALEVQDFQDVGALVMSRF